MIAKVVLLAAVVAVARAGVLSAGYPGVSYAAPALSYGAAVRATPVYRQAPALAYGAAYAAPAYAHGAYAAPAYAHGAYAAPAILKTAIAAPVVAKAVIHEAPQPYEFGYSHQTDDGASSSRQESSDANNAKHGSYSIQNPDGTYRHVEYVADALGFRATIKTNEHGTAPQNPAATQVLAEEPPYKVLPAAAPVVKAVHAAPLLAHAPIVKAAIPAYAPTYAHAAYAAPAYAHAPAYGYAAAPAIVKTHAPAYGSYIH